MLLFLVKHSKSDVANAMRELSKGNDGVNPAAVKKLPCVMKYVLVTKNFGLKLKTNQECE